VGGREYQHPRELLIRKIEEKKTKKEQKQKKRRIGYSQKAAIEKVQ